jgi:CubicO group peptidase (beta-lactamase class C family)
MTDLDARFDLARAAGVLPNVHGVMVLRYAEVIFERYLAGTDAARARPLGVVQIGPATLHDLRSASKSIVGLLYGIALAAGRVPPPEGPLLAQFPEYPDLAADPARQALTVAHALTMTLGTEWDELSLPYSDPRNSEIAMDAAPDRYRYVLERPIACPPGVRWTYSGGATAVLARVIERGTGKPIHAFAREALFDPLGLGATDWGQSATGEAFAASGVRMTLPDFARIGALVLADGAWNGRLLVPRDWLAASLTPAIAMPDGRRYGYQWYLGVVPTDDGAGGIVWERTVTAAGLGGQRLFLVPGRRLVVAVLAGNYDAPDQWRPPLAVLRDVVLPGMR